MIVYDGIAEANGDDECRAWLRKVIDANEIVAFVDGRLDLLRSPVCMLQPFLGAVNVAR
jgi:hypothetical protein